MRLHPPVSEEEALAWLKQQAAAVVGDTPPADLEAALAAVAEAMAAISAAEVHEDVEPHFP